MEEEYKTSLSDILIAMFLSGKSVRNFKSIINERKLKRYKKDSISVTLYRLSKKDYIRKTKEGWQINKGSIKQIKLTQLFSYIPSPFNTKNKRSIIISFDIPGPDRKKRDWLRNQLRIFDYKMLQQSLWAGPGPLPKEFLKRLNELKMKDYIKIFKIKN